MGAISYPYPAHAGFFSFLENFFSGVKSEFLGIDRASAEVVTPPYVNDESVLLNAATNINPVAGRRDAGSLNMVENSAVAPAVGPLGSLADIDEIRPDIISTYTVREGDSVGTIAKTFSVSVNTILWANDIKNANLIKPGDTLVILPVTGIKYTVKTGDTLASIAKKYKGDEGDILAFNGFESASDITAGTEIVIPDGEAPTPPKPKTSTGATRYTGGSGPNIAGYFGRPAVGSRTQGIHGYNGVDIGSSCGSSIFASAAGTVILARSSGYNGGYGLYIVVAHPNGTQTLYAHASAVYVSIGQAVAKGQVIGAVGNTGRSTGCHLHFEVRGAKNPFG